MSEKFARILSVIFHPILMPSYALFVIFWQHTYVALTISPENKSRLFSIVVLNTFMLPIVISYILVRKGWIRSLEMQRREERIVPYLTNLLLMVISAYMINYFLLPHVFFQMTLGAAAAIAVAIVVNIKWKISIHMLGIGCLIGTFFGLSTFLLIDLRMLIIFFLLIAGLLGVARVTLGAHKPSQIYTGFLLGFLCEFLFLSV